MRQRGFQAVVEKPPDLDEAVHAGRNHVLPIICHGEATDDIVVRQLLGVEQFSIGQSPVLQAAAPWRRDYRLSTGGDRDGLHDCPVVESVDQFAGLAVPDHDALSTRGRNVVEPIDRIRLHCIEESSARLGQELDARAEGTSVPRSKRAGNSAAAGRQPSAPQR